MVSLDNQQLELQLVHSTIHYTREKLKYTEDHFNRNLELVPIHSMASVIVAYISFSLFLMTTNLRFTVVLDQYSSRVDHTYIHSCMYMYVYSLKVPSQVP